MMIGVENQRITEEEFPIGLSEEGNKKATTFRNFCQFHDKTLFQDIEDKKYEGIQKQNFLYAFRVFAMQAYKKQLAFGIYSKLLQEYHRHPPAFTYLTSSLYGMKIALDELQYEGAIFEDAIINSNYDYLETTTLLLTYEVKFAVSTFLELNCDLRGNKLNDLANEKERSRKIFFNVFPQDGKTHIILSWLQEDKQFFSDLKTQVLELDQQQLINFLNNVIPCHTEHFVLNPDLWHSHTTEEKTCFLDVFTSTIAMESVNINFLADTSYNLCKKF